MTDFRCERCGSAMGMMVQHTACALRCPRCGAPGSGGLLSTIGDSLHSTYRAVLLDRDSKEAGVIAEGVGRDIVRAVLDAAADGAFVWMKPLPRTWAAPGTTVREQ